VIASAFTGKVRSVDSISFGSGGRRLGKAAFDKLKPGKAMPHGAMALG